MTFGTGLFPSPEEKKGLDCYKPQPQVVGLQIHQKMQPKGYDFSEGNASRSACLFSSPIDRAKFWFRRPVLGLLRLCRAALGWVWCGTERRLSSQETQGSYFWI